MQVVKKAGRCYHLSQPFCMQAKQILRLRTERERDEKESDIHACWGHADRYSRLWD